MSSARIGSLLLGALLLRTVVATGWDGSDAARSWRRRVARWRNRRA